MKKGIKELEDKTNKKRRRYGSNYWIDPNTRLGYARVNVRQPNGKYKQLMERAENVTHAKEIADRIKKEHADRGQGFLTGKKLTFEDLSQWYEKRYLIPPSYDKNGNKIGGMRTFQNEKNKLKRLRKEFGKFLVSEITDTILADYKQTRLKSVSITSVNRDFELLRSIFRLAQARKWLNESPFEIGKDLISKALENSRNITLTGEQENQILDEAKKLKRSRLYYLIVTLLDTGARPSEIYPVNESKAGSDIRYEPIRWRDFFEHDYQMLRLVSYKAKKRRIRLVPMTIRLKNALSELWNGFKETDKNQDDLIFPSGSFKTAWKTVKSNLDISDLRLRDLRRNYSTRLSKTGYPDSLRQRLLGHEKIQTTFDYTEADKESVLLAKKLLDKES